MRRTVLIVEDSEEVAPLEIALAALGPVEVLVVPNGRDAIKVLTTGRLQLAGIVTDLNLPYVDGFELLRVIRAHGRYSRVPVVVVSGDSDPGTPAKVRLLGADAFFSKPYSPAEIRDTLEGLLKCDLEQR
jgi:CheY-like chemotaxis protein